MVPCRVVAQGVKRGVADSALRGAVAHVTANAHGHADACASHLREQDPFRASQL